MALGATCLALLAASAVAGVRGGTAIAFGADERSGAQTQPAVPPAFGDDVARPPAFLHMIGGLVQPGGISFDRAGRLLVSDTGANVIRIYDDAGRPAGVWGPALAGTTALRGPRGIAAGPDGLIYVVDAGGPRIVVLDEAGRHIRSWGTRGADNGRMLAPSSIAVAPTRVYVADPGRGRVLCFDTQGRFVREIGGDESGRLRRPMGVACDDRGRVYLADADNCRIHRFNADGRFEAAWGEFGPFPGMLANPSGLAWHAGRLYVADSQNHRIQAFDPGGELLGRWGVHAIRPRESNGRLHYPDAVAVRGDGARVAVLEGFADRCQVFGPHDPAVPPDPLGAAGIDLSQSSHYGPLGDCDGGLLALIEPEAHSVIILDLTGRDPILLTRIGTYGRYCGQLIRPTDVALDAKNSLVYVSDAGNRRLQVFRLHRRAGETPRFDPFMARFVKSLDLSLLAEESNARGGPRRGPIIEPTAIALEPSTGNLFLLDAQGAAIYVLSPRLGLIRTFGAYGDETGQFRDPTDLGFSADGRALYVVDAGNRRIQAFDPSGSFLRQWAVHSHSTEAPVAAAPFGIAPAPDGSVYVTDAAAHRVLQFDARGAALRAWGTPGLGPGQLHLPRGVCIAPGGRVVVIDHGNHRGMVFTADGNFLDAFGSPFFVEPARAGRTSTTPSEDQ